MPDRKEIIRIAENLIERDISPVPRFRLMRDVMSVPKTDPDFIKTAREVNKSKHVSELGNAQLIDGSWGRFHSMETALKQRFATTETAVERGLVLGLDRDKPIFQKTVKYFVRLLQGQISFPDPPENNDRWKYGCQLFTAGTLARIDPGNQNLDSVAQLWIDILNLTFKSGNYNLENEIAAHKKLTGINVKGSYLCVRSKYHASLFGARARELPPQVESSYVKWIFETAGIGYLDSNLQGFKSVTNAGEIERWFQSQELLANLPSWKFQAKSSIDWLWSQQKDGTWDFGKRASRPYAEYFPLSDDWRKPFNRKVDWSVRVLALMSRFYQE